MERQLERELATVNVYLDEAIASLKQVEAENERLRHERDLLGQALGELLVAMGAVTATGLTGPELLFHAEQTARDFQVGEVKVVSTNPQPYGDTNGGDDG